jgi:hypothetical protein
LLRTSDNTLDRVIAERLMSDDGQAKKSPRQSLYLATLVDSLRHIPRRPVKTHRRVSIKRCNWQDVCNTWTIPNLHHHVHHLCYFSALTDKTKHSIEYILSKTLNRKCNSRKLWKKSSEAAAATDSVGTQIRQLVACSLLGNYLHTPSSSRPRGSVRVKLYSLLIDDHQLPLHTSWFAQLMFSCVQLLIFTIRDYLVFAVHESPALFARLKVLMNFDQFTAITQDGVHKARQYFQQNLCEPLSCLYGAVEGTCPNDRWCHEIVWLLHDCHARILKINYKRPKPSIGEVLLKARKGIPLRPSPVAAIGQAYLHPSHHQSLMYMIKRINPNHPRLLDLMTPWLETLSVPKHAITILRVLSKVYYQHEGNDVDQFRDYLRQVARRYPHAYNVWQLAAELQQDVLRFRMLGDLPHQYVVNQLDACQTRYHTKSLHAILSDCLYFCFCPICDTVYSLLREYAAPNRKPYQHGYLDARVDYRSDVMYCDKRKVIGSRGRCGAQPLRKVFLLGKVFWFNDRTIILCPQEACGMPMVLDANLCAFNERGYACSVCTVRLRKQSPILQELHRKYVTEPQATSICLLCGIALNEPKSIFEYPHCVRLCRRHHNKEMVRNVEQFMECQTGEVSKAIVEKKMVEFAQAAKDRRAAFRKGRDKLQLKHSKQATRSRK